MANGDDDFKIHGTALNGYKVRSWGDLMAIATLLALFVGVLAWGLKLESELNEVRSNHNARLTNLEARVANGILPRAEERINSQGGTIRRHEARLDRLENKVDDHSEGHP